MADEEAMRWMQELVNKLAEEESSYFIQMEGNKVDLTPGGVSVTRSDKRT